MGHGADRYNMENLGIPMTWSVSATLTGNTDSAELALDFFENYLGNITGWETTALFNSGAYCNEV